VELKIINELILPTCDSLAKGNLTKEILSQGSYKSGFTRTFGRKYYINDDTKLKKGRRALLSRSHKYNMCTLKACQGDAEVTHVTYRCHMEWRE
jgi:hypothetical protein